MEKLEVEERHKIAAMRREKGSQSSGVDWMYKTDKPDSEEYLLGKRIDKHIEGTTEPKEDDANAIFGERIKANIAMDMAAKMREDPLFAIRRKEEESRKKLLENPVRMKELQKLIDLQQKKKEKAGKKKKKKDKKSKKKKKHKKKDSDEDESEEEQGDGDSGGDEDDIMKKYLAILTSKQSAPEAGRKRRRNNEGDNSDSQSEEGSESGDDRARVGQRRNFRKQSSPALNRHGGSPGHGVHEDRGQYRQGRDRGFEQGQRNRRREDDWQRRASSPRQRSGYGREWGSGDRNRIIDGPGNRRMGDRGRAEGRENDLESDRNRERLGNNQNWRKYQRRDSRSRSRERTRGNWRSRENTRDNRVPERMRENRSRSRERTRENRSRSRERMRENRSRSRERMKDETRQGIERRENWDRIRSGGTRGIERDDRAKQGDMFRDQRKLGPGRDRDREMQWDGRYSLGFRGQEQGVRGRNSDDHRVTERDRKRRGSFESEDSEEESATRASREEKHRNDETWGEFRNRDFKSKTERDKGMRKDSFDGGTRERARNDSRGSHSDIDGKDKQQWKGREQNLKKNARKEKARSRSSSSASSSSSSSASNSSADRNKLKTAFNSKDNSLGAKPYGLIRPNKPSSNKRKRSSSASSSASSSSSSSSPQKRSYPSFPTKQKPQRQATPPRRKLTDDEKQRRLDEMMDNAKWRDEQRQGNVKRYREEEAKERDDKEKSRGKGFLSSMMVNHASTSSVEDRLKRNRYNIQRTKVALNKSFTKK